MNRDTLAFFGLAYLFSWCAFIPLALSAQGLIPSAPSWLHLAGSFGPLLAAFCLTAWRSGRVGLRELWERMTRWRIGLGWFLVAWLSPVVLFLIVAVGQATVSNSWRELFRFGKVDEFPDLCGLAGWLVWTLTFGLGEETGWRGYVLPRLQVNYNARSASLIVGLFWAGWHIPAFFYNYDPSLFNVVAFLIGILSGSALLTWLYNSTGGSLLAVVLWHGSYNAAVAGAGPITSATITAAVILAVIMIGRRYGPESLSHRPAQKKLS